MVTVVRRSSTSQVAIRGPAPTSRAGGRRPQSGRMLAAIPQLGFSSYVVSGTGEYVLSVHPGSIAMRMGLEPGDVILALNDYHLRCEGAWDRAMARLPADQGAIVLRIRSGRTGEVAQRSCRLFP